MRNGKIHSCAYQYEYNIDEQRDALWQEETVDDLSREARENGVSSFDALGRDASMGDLAAIDVAGRGRGDVAKDLQNQSICCSKFACTNLQANKILARCVFAHTIQCNKMIADSVTRVSKSQWEQRKQGYIAVDDAWDGVQSGNVMANQIDAETIQADG